MVSDSHQRGGRWGKLSDVRALDQRHDPHDYSGTVYISRRDGYYHQDKNCAIGEFSSDVLVAMLAEWRAMRAGAFACLRCTGFPVPEREALV